MTLNKAYQIVLLFIPIIHIACHAHVKEEDKIFHAGPVNSGFGGIFFALYKYNKYQFCDGDFMYPGCYTGDYSLSSDTIVLHKLKEHSRIPSNRFIIRRYQYMDSSYWQWKYPDYKDDWKMMRRSDSLRGSTGDVFPLDQKSEIVFDKDNYFLIRHDQKKNNR